METAEAWQAIQRGLADEAPLRQRTEGLSVGIWGLALPAMFVTFGLIHETQGHEGNPALGFLWVPWLLAGWMLSEAVWKLARLQAQQLPAAKWPTWVMALAFLLAYGAAAAVALQASATMSPTAMGLLGVAALWTLMAVLDVRRRTAVGRRLDIALGVGWFLLGILVALTSLAAQAQTVVAALATGLPPLTIGLVRALRA